MTANGETRARYDAVIVGARVAGAATALLLARAGLSVLVIDRAKAGSDTLSTLALMRGGVQQLARWGVLPDVAASGAPPIRAVTFHYGDDGLTIPIKARGGVDALYGPRRTVLDPLLVEAARAAGAEVVFGARLQGLTRNAAGRVTGVVLAYPDGSQGSVGASVVIGADGMRSTVAELVGAMPYRTSAHAAAVVYGVWSDLDVEPGQFHWHFRPGVSAGVIPTNGGACVFAGVAGDRFDAAFKPHREAGYLAVLDEASADLGTAVRRAASTEPLRGFTGHPGFLRPAWGGGWALVGDAGYFKDPITAHGLTDALRDAELLAQAVVEGTDDALASYQAQRDRLSSDLFDVTDEIAGYHWTLARIRELHEALNAAMAREARAMAAFSGIDARAR